MSASWHGDEYRADAVPWWQAVGVVLLVSGLGPLALVQVAWWLVTGSVMGGA